MGKTVLGQKRSVLIFTLCVLTLLIGASLLLALGVGKTRSASAEVGDTPSIEAGYEFTVSFDAGSNTYTATNGAAATYSDAVLQTVLEGVTAYSASEQKAVKISFADLTTDEQLTLDVGGPYVLEGALALTYASASGDNFITLDGVEVHSSATISTTTDAASIDENNVEIAGANMIYMTGDAALYVKDGMLSATAGHTIYNNSNGVINISGGTVSATTGRAIWNNAAGHITVGGGNDTATVTSSTVKSYTLPYGAASGTLILFGGAADATSDLLTIKENAVISNTNNSSTMAIAVRKYGVGSIRMEGGTVSALSGRGMFCEYSGQINISGGNIYSSSETGLFARWSITVNISGGTVSSDTKYGISTQSNTTTNITGGTISTLSGSAIYTPTNTNISGGTIKATTGNAIHGILACNISITGGTVTATTGNAILYDANGKIKISQASDSVPTRVEVTDPAGVVVSLSEADRTKPVLSLYGEYFSHPEVNAGNEKYINDNGTGTAVELISTFTESEGISKSDDGIAGAISYLGGADFDDVAWTWAKKNAEDGFDAITGGTDGTLERTDIVDSGIYKATAVVSAYGYSATFTSEEISVDIDHSFTDYVSNDDATCTLDGTETATCDNCTATDTRTEAGSALGHDESGAAATCTTDKVCARSGCDHVLTAKLGHDESGAAATCTTDKVCARSGCDHVLTEKLGHDESGAAATCTTDKVCARSGCDHVLTAKLGHEYKSVVTAPTYTADGYTTYTCEDCDDSYTGNTVAKLTYSIKASDDSNVSADFFDGYVLGEELDAPTRDKYTFGGWYLDEALTKEVTAVTAAELNEYVESGTLTLYAKWEKKSGCGSSLAPTASGIAIFVMLSLCAAVLFVRRKAVR